jgi:hypothetical protein
VFCEEGRKGVRGDENKEKKRREGRRVERGEEREFSR